MGGLASFERRLSSLVEGAFAKVFRGGVEPVEIAGALQREIDARGVISARRTLVPNTFVVDLGDKDHDRLVPYAEPLTDELAEMVREHATAQGYSFAGPVTVRLAHDPALHPGVFRVHADVSHDGAQVLPGPPPVAPPPAVTSGSPPSVVEPPRRQVPAPGVARPGARLVLGSGGQAMVGSPEAEGLERAYLLTAAVTRIGRAHDVDLRLDDTSVSRHHVEVRRLPDGEHHLLVDLGSTNGTRVNGQRTQTWELHDSDRVEVGSVTIVYRNDEENRDDGGRQGGEGSGPAVQA